MPSTPPSATHHHRHLDFPRSGSGDYVHQGLAFTRLALTHWRPAAGAAGLTDALLLTSELLSNALEHAHGPLALDLHLDSHAEQLRIEVTDTVPTGPRVCWGQPDEPYGRGLHIVDRLATAWGSSPAPDGKTVWAVLRLPGTEDG